MRVCVTGAAGWTASAIVAALIEAGHEVRGLDLPGIESRAPAGCDLWRGDVAELEDLLPFVDGAGAIVHLAVAVTAGDYETLARPLRTNVGGTYALFEAARGAGVGCVILIGSAAVHQPPLEGRVLSARLDPPLRAGPDFLYDLTKQLQEQIARQFCRAHAMTAITLRAGHVVDSRAGTDPHGTPLSELDYCRGGWICRYDLAAAVLAALRWNGTGYEAFHVIGSHEARAHFDLERTESELGFAPAARFSDP